MSACFFRLSRHTRSHSMGHLSHRTIFTRSCLSVLLDVVVVFAILLSITTVFQGGYIYEFRPFLITEEVPPPCEVMHSAEDIEDQCLPGIMASPLDNGNVDEPTIEDECTTGE